MDFFLEGREKFQFRNHFLNFSSTLYSSVESSLLCHSNQWIHFIVSLLNYFNGGDSEATSPRHHASWVLCPCLGLSSEKTTSLSSRRTENGAQSCVHKWPQYLLFNKPLSNHPWLENGAHRGSLRDAKRCWVDGSRSSHARQPPRLLAPELLKWIQSVQLVPNGRLTLAKECFGMFRNVSKIRKY